MPLGMSHEAINFRYIIVCCKERSLRIASLSDHCDSEWANPERHGRRNSIFNKRDHMIKLSPMKPEDQPKREV